MKNSFFPPSIFCFFIRVTYIITHRHPSCDACAAPSDSPDSVSANEASAKCALSPRHIVAAIFVERAIRSAVKQAKRTRSRFRLCPLLFAFRAERRWLRVHPRANHLSSFRSVRPSPGSSSSGWELCRRDATRSVYLFERSKNYRSRAAARRCLPFDRGATTRNFACFERYSATAL